MPRLPREVAVRACLVLASALLALLAGELALRLAGFEFPPVPLVQLGPTLPRLARAFRPDPDLLWVPRDYAAVLAAARLTRPPVVFLGDSNTQFGTYPEKTLQLLRRRRPAPLRGLALGVGGWSSEQGLRQLRRDVLPLRPRLVTLFFGWNDHWVALGAPDPDTRLTPTAAWLAEHSRLAQALLKGRLATSRLLERLRAPAPRPNRVPLERYTANLESMVRLLHQAAAQAVLITAPANHVPGHEPPALRLRNLRHLGDLVPLHQAYVEATRRAARETGAVLCDAAAAFPRLPPPPSQYFRADGIHLTEAGDQQLAALLAPCLEAALGRNS